MDSLNVLSLLSQVGGSSNCTCGKSGIGSSNLIGGSSFDVVMTSLLKAVQESGSQNISSSQTTGGSVTNNILNIVVNKGESSKLLDSIVNGGVINTNNISKIEPTNKDESINIRIKNAVSKASKDYGVDADLIMAIIKTESSFNPNCVSKADAKGLMQLMPENCKHYGVSNPFDIEENIDAGTRHIKDYIDKYDGDIEMALMAYNGGPTRMAKRGVKSIADIYKMPEETQNYVPKVMKLYRGY